MTRRSFAVSTLVMGALMTGFVAVAPAKHKPGHDKKMSMDEHVKFCPCCKADLSRTKPKGAAMGMKINGKTYYCTACGEMMKGMHKGNMKMEKKSG